MQSFLLKLNTIYYVCYVYVCVHVGVDDLLWDVFDTVTDERLRRNSLKVPNLSILLVLFYFQ